MKKIIERIKETVRDVRAKQEYDFENSLDGLEFKGTIAFGDYLRLAKLVVKIFTVVMLPFLFVDFGSTIRPVLFMAFIHLIIEVVYRATGHRARHKREIEEEY